MNLKTALLAALGALFIAAPVAVQAQDSNSSYYYDEHPDTGYTHHRHYSREGHDCHLGKAPRYGVFGRKRNRLTIVC
jgi:hypothetical protein